MLRASLLSMVSFTLVFSGCQQATTSQSGGSQTNHALASRQLSALGQAYHSYHLSNKKGPANWDEAISSGDSAALTALRDDGCLVAWGVRFRDATIGVANFVLAYPPSTLEDGGPVLMLDGTVLQAKPEPLKKMLEEQADLGVPK